MQDPSIWQDYERIQSLNQQLVSLKKREEKLEKIEEELKENTLKDPNEIEKEIEEMERISLLKGEYDKNNAFMMLHAGTGGVDACDWVEILCRMYLKFFEKKGWQARIIDQSLHKEAGYKSVTLQIIGDYVYGFLKGEAGVHRLVRISPFDAEKMRHTSFASVEILPEFEENTKIQIKDEDLKTETFLASGHGGQNVQKTQTAVRVTHLPTGLSVSSQSERSQSQNKRQAFKILQAKLLMLSEGQRAKEKAKIKGPVKSISWGNQIRSYVFQPYQLVKDLRTGHETSDLKKVLDGDLEPFINSYLGSQIK